MVTNWLVYFTAMDDTRPIAPEKITMIKIIQQQHKFDCTPTCYAMWLGISHEEIKKVCEKLEIWGKSFTDDMETKLGKHFGMNIFHVKGLVFTDIKGVCGFPSLNFHLKGHSVYYEDYVFYDPETCVEGMKAYPSKMDDFDPWPYGVNMAVDLNDEESKHAVNYYVCEQMKVLDWWGPIKAYEATTQYEDKNHQVKVHNAMIDYLKKRLENKG